MRMTPKKRAVRNAYIPANSLTTQQEEVKPASHHQPLQESENQIFENQILMRRCIISNQPAPQSVMIRFALSPDDMLTPDIAQKLPGRGIWLIPTPEHILMAEKGQLLIKKAQKIYQTKVHLKEDLQANIATALLHHITQTLSLMRRAGQAIQGMDKIKTLLKNKNFNDKKAMLLMMKPISSLQAGQKIITLAKEQHVSVISGLPERIACDSFNRENAPFVLIMGGGLAERLLPYIDKYLLMMGDNQMASDEGSSAVNYKEDIS